MSSLPDRPRFDAPTVGEPLVPFTFDAIHASRESDEALRFHQDEVFSALIENAPFGVYVVDSHFRLRAINKGAEAVFRGVDPLLGRDFGEILRVIWPEASAAETIAAFTHTLATGEPHAALGSKDPRGHIDRAASYDWQIQRMTLPDGTFGVVCYFYDLTRFQEAEAAITSAAQRDAFLVTLNDRLRPLTDALEIQTEAVRVLGEHLQTDWVHLAEYDEDLAFATIRCEYVRGEVQRLAGRYPVEGIGPLLTVLQDGHTVAESDMATSALVTPEGRAMYAAVGVRGHAAAPVVKRHRLLAAIGVCDRAPRAWTAQEIALIEATAERTWAALERARAERALRDSEARLQLALGMSNMGTFVWHIQADRGEFDARMLALFGLREDERFSLTAPSSVMHPDDRTRYARAVAHAIDPAGPGALREEVRVLHPDGDERWLFIAGQTVFEPEMGQAVRMSGMAADITERKNRENALVFLTDLGGEFSRAASTDEVMQAAGEKVSAFLGVSACYVMTIDEDRDEARMDYEWALEGGPRVPEIVRISDFITDELRCVARAGSTVVVGNTQTDHRTHARAYAALGLGSYLFHPILRDGAWKHLVAVCDSQPRDWRAHEIALCRELSNRLLPRLERARAGQTVANDLRDTQLLQALSAQLIGEQGSASLYETLIDAAVSIMQSEFVSLQMLHPERGTGGALHGIASRGFSPDALRDWEWIDCADKTVCAAALRAGTRVVVSDIEACEWMAGTVTQARYLREGIRAIQSTPLVSRGGKALGMISTHWAQPHRPSERELRLLDILARMAADLMERTQAEDALRRNEQTLREADRRKDEFLAMLAHELRNPLAPLRTGLELIRLAGNTTEAVASVRTMMEEQVAQMVRLIEDLLDVSRITTGNIRLQRRPTLLSTLVNAAIEANRTAIRHGRMALEVNVPDVPVLVDVDPTRFVQILSNVLHNAVKFTDAGGRITLAVHVEAPDGSDAEHVVLTVTDSGIGIPAELLPRVFDLFTQDDRSRHHADGLGIGLALARRLIELHGGSIEGYSDGLALGSTFRMRLPRSTEAVTPEAPPPQVAALSPIHRRVVVIDDNVSAAVAMQRLVRALGGECRVAYDGVSGLEQVLDFAPDLIFLDIGMPGIDGYETCRRIRRAIGPGAMLVAMTGWGQERDKQAALRAGFDMHLTKPADPTVLENLLSDPKRPPAV